MELLFYGIGFAICYFAFDLNWWMSLLIAFAAPVIISLVSLVVESPIMGISALVEKIRRRRESPYCTENFKAGFYEQAARVENTEDSSLLEVQSFLIYLMDKGVHTRTTFIREGKATMNFSEVIIGRALDSLMEAKLIKRIGSNAYYRIGTVVQENDIVEEPANEQTTDSHRMASMLFEIEKEREKQSNTLGIWSLVLGITGIFTFIVPIAAVASIVLGILQFRRHVSKCSIAGLVLGLIGIVLFIVLIRLLGYETPYPMTA